MRAAVVVRSLLRFAMASIMIAMTWLMRGMVHSVLETSDATLANVQAAVVMAVPVVRINTAAKVDAFHYALVSTVQPAAIATQPMVCAKIPAKA